MRQIDSTDFPTHFGQFIDLVRAGPITVLRGSQPVGVFLSPAEYEHLQGLDDAFWIARAEAAIARGEFLSPDEVPLELFASQSGDR